LPPTMARKKKKEKRKNVFPGNSHKCSKGEGQLCHGYKKMDLRRIGKTTGFGRERKRELGEEGTVPFLVQKVGNQKRKKSPRRRSSNVIFKIWGTFLVSPFKSHQEGKGRRVFGPEKAEKKKFSELWFQRRGNVPEWEGGGAAWLKPKSRKGRNSLALGHNPRAQTTPQMGKRQVHGKGGEKSPLWTPKKGLQCHLKEGERVIKSLEPKGRASHQSMRTKRNVGERLHANWKATQKKARNPEEIQRLPLSSGKGTHPTDKSKGPAGSGAKEKRCAVGRRGPNRAED